MLFRARKQSSLLLAAIFLAASGCSLEGLADLPELPGDEAGERGENADISGVIVDGYVEGAQVFLDLNKNQQHDEDEPSAESDARGGFVLHVSNFDRTLLKDAFLQAEIPDSAKDSDDMGRTLREAGKKGFTLLSPASALLEEDEPASSDGKASDAREPIKPAVLSPLSTLVVGEMIERGLPLAEAKASVQNALGLPDKELLHDFVAQPDAVLHNVARAAAVSLGEAALSKAGGDAGVPMRPGAGVVDAVRSVKEQLPQVIDALGLRSEMTMPASVDRVRAEFGEQVKRTEEARAAMADAGMRLPDPTIGMLPPGVDGGALDPMRLPIMPPMNAGGADAGVRLPEPMPMMPPPMIDGGAGPVPPPPPVDGAVLPIEMKPADGGVRPDAAPPPTGYPMPMYPPSDAGAAVRK